ncbi:MAG TPA: substrate-binding domain-containing protein [Spirochaetota bacterium]|nr:substrate-binding domain-containing protein [Spirochaetota bacterium]HPI88860.1 substrate-binding domain-containing protein [Spirochaetota bacterium]HPR47010.1 substrate-binding domain-containing protein [Spirochaetota bacterium]
MNMHIKPFTLITLLICSALIFSCLKSDDSNKTRITLSGAWALYPMAVAWAEEYQNDHPNIIIDISAGGAGKGMADALSNTVDLGMVSRDVNEAEIAKGAWWVSVVKDAVVPVINSNNPLSEKIRERGLKNSEFTRIWVSGTIKKWNTLVSDAKDLPLRVYTRSDACGAAETWAKYMEAKQEDLKGVGVYGDPGIADAVKKDPLGLGYNNINYAFDAKTKKPVDGITPLPLDINGNGKIDANEKFYDTRDQIVNAIASGKYPSPPARNLHLVSQGQPKDKEVKDFLYWILTDGQSMVDSAGYIPISKDLLETQKNKLK